MLDKLYLLITPLISFIAVVLGGGLLSTLLPLRLEMEQVSEIIIGFISSAVYIGITLGSFKIESLVSRIGHIRAYAAFTAVLTVATLMMGLYYNALLWFLIRLVFGYCMSGVFIVIESWVLASGTSSQRGRLLALYMGCMYLAQAGGQFLLYFGNISSLELFCLIAVLMGLSIVPLALTRMNSPIVHEPSALKLNLLYQVSPTGMIGAFISGIVLSCIYSLVPLYCARVDIPVPMVMGMMILGGMVLQYPMGKLSDYFDRRKMILTISLSISMVAIVLLLCTNLNFHLFLTVAVIFGGASFTLYPLSISHTCDFVSENDIVAATQGLLLAYGLGAIVGPTSASIFMEFHHGGLLVFIALVTFSFAVFSYKRSSLSRAPMQKHRFIVNNGITPVGSGVESRFQIDDKK